MMPVKNACFIFCKSVRLCGFATLILLGIHIMVYTLDFQRKQNDGSNRPSVSVIDWKAMQYLLFACCIVLHLFIYFFLVSFGGFNRAFSNS